MTIRQLMTDVSMQPMWVQLAALAIPVVFTLFCSLFHEEADGNQWPWKYVYSLIIFAVCIPGIFSMVVTGYSMFFASENLLDANVLFIFGPLATMLLTVQVIKWNRISIDRLPGFKRLIGFGMMIGAASVGALLINKSRIVIWGGLSEVMQIFAGLLVIMYLGYYFLFCQDDPDDVAV